MYFIKFGNIAVLVKDSGKLVRRGLRLSSTFYTLDSDDDFITMSKRSPFANCRRSDYFNQIRISNRTQNVIPGYVMDYVLNLPEVKVVILSIERDTKINQILK
jgi:hypothetical protein